MAKVNPKDREAVMQENIEQTVSATEQFLNDNKKTIIGALVAVVVVGLGILGYSKLIYQPQVKEAMAQTYPAETNFQNGEYELALNGDGNNLGFAQIIEDYGKKAGKAVYFYAGVCELQLGNYESALSYIKKYDGKEPILAARAKACEGDAYVGLEDYSSAIKAYEAAVAEADNIFAATYLLKAGLSYEALGDKAAALKCYTTIQDSYPSSIEAYDIAKYIARVAE